MCFMLDVGLGVEEVGAHTSSKKHDRLVRHDASAGLKGKLWMLDGLTPFEMQDSQAHGRSQLSKLASENARRVE